MKSGSVPLTLCLFAVVALVRADERTLQLTNPSTLRGMQEIATILRTVGDIKNLSLDAPHASFAVSGTPAELDFAEWIVHQVDRPAGWQPSEQDRNNPSTREYHLAPGTPNGVARAFYLTSTLQPRPTQETLTILRTVLDVQKIFNYTDHHILVYRGPAAQVEAVDWTLKILDSPAGTPVPTEPWRLDSKPFDLLRVFSLPPDTTSPQMQQLITVLRRDDFVMKVFSLSNPPLLVEAATAPMLDQTAKRIAELITSAR